MLALLFLLLGVLFIVFCSSPTGFKPKGTKHTNAQLSPGVFENNFWVLLTVTTVALCPESWKRSVSLSLTCIPPSRDGVAQVSIYERVTLSGVAFFSEGKSRTTLDLKQVIYSRVNLTRGTLLMYQIVRKMVKPVAPVVELFVLYMSFPQD
jgi:hypothetical protein